MRNKILLIGIAIIFTINACKKDETPAYVFTRGQIISTIDAGSRSAENIRTMFTIYDPSFAAEIDYKYGVDMYAIIYETITPDGEETQASGLLAVPQSMTTSASLVSFQHGTILKKTAIPSSLGVGSGMELGLIFGTEGYVVCMPDFLGLGAGKNLHPYMHSKSEATATIDMMRAAKNKLEELGIQINDELFLLGYSQGGHATMATHKAIEEEYNDEFTVTASAPMAGPFDVSGIMADIVLRKEEYIAPAFLPYMMYAYNMVYNIYDDLESNFKSPYNADLPPFFDGESLYSLSDVNQKMPAIPSDILTDAAYNAIMDKTDAKLWAALEDNDLYDWTPVAPIRMFHCNGDVTVPMANSEKALQSFIDKGVTNVDLVNPFEGGTHSTCLLPSILGAKNWINSF